MRAAYGMGIVLGIICIVLFVVLVRTVTTYESMVSNRIADWNQQKADYVTQISDLQSQVSKLTRTGTLQEDALLVDRETVSQPANSYSNWYFNPAYAGYIMVDVTSSTNNTYVAMIWSTLGVNYNEQITLGSHGIARFPVLPTMVELRVGNTDLSGEATENVTVIDVY